MAYDALVFDNDGVLTTPTTHEVLVGAIADAFDAVGVSDPPRSHVETLIAPTVDELRSIALAHDVEISRLWEARERAAIEAQYRSVREGTKRLYDDVDAVRSLSIPRAIVSNNQHETIANIVEFFDLDDFDPWIGREPTIDGIRRKKPRPYYLERALDALDVRSPLFVGDSRADVAAASAADVDVAFLRRPHRTDYELDVQPTYQIDSLDALAELVTTAEPSVDRT